MAMGRYLHLDTWRLDKVTSYEKFGTQEMFWQLIHQYYEASNGQASISTLLGCLRETGINLEGNEYRNIHLIIISITYV